MRKICVLGLGILLALSAAGQRVEGVWKGILTQNKGGLDGTYTFQMKLRQRGETVKGYSIISLVDDPKIFGVLALEGNFREGYLYFKETQVGDAEVPDEWNWCLKRGRLEFVDQGDSLWKLEGFWQGTVANPSCPPGNIYVSRTPGAEDRLDPPPVVKVRDREVEVGDTVSLKSRSVTLYVWDMGKPDGDIITLLLNGEEVATNIHLSKTKKKISLTLPEDSKEPNILVMYSIDEGRLPPNTAAMAFKYGDKWKKIKMRSDGEVSGAVRLVLGGQSGNP